MFPRRSDDGLKAILFAEYGGFADKRIKRLEKGDTFIIDDRTEQDVGADKRLLSYFCMMFARVEADAVDMTLSQNVPTSPAVIAWIEQTGAGYGDTVFGKSLRFSVARGEQSKLRVLASLIRSIVATGARYAVPSYKYVCPRTAKSLERLAAVLDSAWVEAPADGES